MTSLRTWRAIGALFALAAAWWLAAGCGGDDGTRPPVDTAPPSAVADLRVSAVTDSSATLAWTAPGDDGASGRPCLSC